MSNQQTKIQLEPNGKLNIEGNVSSDDLEKLLAQAQYYRLKAEKLQEKQLQLDSIVVTFLGFAFLMLVFCSYMGVKAISNSLFNHKEGTSYVR